jgi:type III secretion protein J
MTPDILLIPIVDGRYLSVIPPRMKRLQEGAWSPVEESEPVAGNQLRFSSRLKKILQQISLTLLLLGCLAACKGRVELINSVSEAEANEALSALLEGGIKAAKLPGKEGTVSLDVAEDEVAKAIAILRTEGLPRERYAKMGEVFRKEGLISSPLEERARYIWALSQEISATVSQIDGVIKARVHVVLPEHSAGGDPSLPSSAAVFIKHKAGVNLEESVPQIKRLVANSIPGLSGEKVSVILIASSGREAESDSKPSTSSTEAPAAAVSSKPVDSKVLGNQDNLLERLPQSPVILWSGLGLLMTLVCGAGLLLWRQWRKYKQALIPPAGLVQAAEDT